MKHLHAFLAASLLMVAMLLAPAAQAQCDRYYPDGAVVAHALQDQTVRNFVLPYRQGNFWVESVTVNQGPNGYFVSWTFTPSCYYSTPACLMPTQIVCADLDCDLTVIAICVS